MKTESTYCARVIDFSSLGVVSSEEQRTFFEGLPIHGYAKFGTRMFVITEVQVEPVNTNSSKPSRSKSVKSDQRNASQQIGKVVARELYDEYREYFDLTYKQKKRETEEYGAKKYAAQKTVEKIWSERKIALSVRNVINAMNLRMSK